MKVISNEMESSLELAEFLPYRLSVVTNKISDLIAKSYESLGLSRAQWRVIAVLGEQPGLTASAVAERTAQDRVTVTRAVKGLVQNKLLQRQASQDDGRVAYLRLTAKGLRAYKKVVPSALAFEQALTQALSSKERQQFDKTLEKLELLADQQLSYNND